MHPRESKLIALRERHSDLLGHKWTGNRLFGCYEIIRKYYRKELNRELIDFNARKVYAFTDDAISEEEGYWVYRKDWGGEVEFSVMLVYVILLFRVYSTGLGGGYSAPTGRAPNHGGVYLGDGFMLHHPYGGLSDVEDLFEDGVKIYQAACVGAIRGNTT